MKTERERIIRMVDERQDIVYLEDGFYYYWPDNHGCLSSYNLRIIADELDLRNKAWEDQIEQDFGPGGQYCVEPTSSDLNSDFNLGPE